MVLLMVAYIAPLLSVLLATLLDPKRLAEDGPEAPSTYARRPEDPTALIFWCSRVAAFVRSYFLLCQQGQIAAQKDVGTLSLQL